MTHLRIQIKTYAGLPDELHYFTSDDVYPFKVVKLDECNASHLLSLARELRGEKTESLALHTFTEEFGETSPQAYRTTLETLWRTVNRTHMSEAHLGWAVTFVQCSTADARAEMPTHVTA